VLFRGYDGEGIGDRKERKGDAYIAAILGIALLLCQGLEDICSGRSKLLLRKKGCGCDCRLKSIA
jgi:hypothetical protein